MPEIAEVRVVRDALKRQILNKRITGVIVLCPSIIVGSVTEFREKMLNQKFNDIKTCGKWLIFLLDDYAMLSHLRMEGKYFYVPKGTPLRKHTHVIFSLDNDYELRYDDVRKFGKMELTKLDEWQKAPSIAKLGLEPEDEHLSKEYLLSKFKNKNLPIKSVLLDQTIINGLGNIYANEVLFASKINPFKKAREITSNEAVNIIKNAYEITRKSYQMGGCTIRSYTSSLGVIGHYQDELKVHGKENRPCPICNAPIIREKIDGRSTYYCKNCQK